MFRRILTVLAVLVATSAGAQERVLGTYMALIGTEDLFNSKGTRLTDAGSIIRQDRANFHKFGIRHQYDDPDPWFGSAAGRNGMERLVRMSAFTEQIIVRQGALVAVTVFANGNRISRITVDIPG